MKPTLKPPGTQRSQLKCDMLLSTSAFKFNLRRYSKANVIPHSLEVIMSSGNMWFNPKLPAWAKAIKGGVSSLLKRQQAAGSYTRPHLSST